MKKSLSYLASATTIVGMLSWGVAAAAVTPASVSGSLAPGGTMTVAKTVTTPVIPPNPDIIFLADTTASMGSALANVQANATTIMNTVLASQPTAQFGVAEYQDFELSSFGFNLDQAVTANTSAVNTAIGTWTATGGGDVPEAQINALNELATNTAVGFRTGSTRIVVWFGDASGHDPSNGVTQAQAIAALNAAGVHVIAVPVISGSADGLDATGQATAITSATGGSLQASATPAQVSAAILAGLSNLPVTVSWSLDASCSPNLTVALTPASQTVTSGTSASFSETITVSPSATEGSTLTCTVHFHDEKNNPLGDELITIKIPDKTPPKASCVQGTNPSGKNIPKASKTNEDGFYQLLASDNIAVASIVVRDSGSSFVSNPFASGDTVKITQAPGATPSDSRPGPGVIVSQLKLKGDAIVRVTDTAGNATEVTCLVPPPPK